MTTIARLAAAVQTARDLAREWEAETFAVKKAAYDAPDCLPFHASAAWHSATADHHASARAVLKPTRCKRLSTQY